MAYRPPFMPGTDEYNNWFYSLTPAQQAEANAGQTANYQGGLRQLAATSQPGSPGATFDVGGTGQTAASLGLAGGGMQSSGWQQNIAAGRPGSTPLAGLASGSRPIKVPQGGGMGAGIPDWQRTRPLNGDPGLTAMDTPSDLASGYVNDPNNPGWAYNPGGSYDESGAPSDWIQTGASNDGGGRVQAGGGGGMPGGATDFNGNQVWNFASDQPTQVYTGDPSQNQNWRPMTADEAAQWKNQHIAEVDAAAVQAGADANERNYLREKARQDADREIQQQYADQQRQQIANTNAYQMGSLGNQIQQTTNAQNNALAGYASNPRNYMQYLMASGGMGGPMNGFAAGGNAYAGAGGNQGALAGLATSAQAINGQVQQSPYVQQLWAQSGQQGANTGLNAQGQLNIPQGNQLDFRRWSPAIQGNTQDWQMLQGLASAGGVDSNTLLNQFTQAAPKGQVASPTSFR